MIRILKAFFRTNIPDDPPVDKMVLSSETGVKA